MSNELFRKEKIDEYLSYIEEKSKCDVFSYTKNETDNEGMYTRSLPDKCIPEDVQSKSEVNTSNSENTRLRFELLESENRRLRLELLYNGEKKPIKIF
jgi:hypothetical protein